MHDRTVSADALPTEGDRTVEEPQGTLVTVALSANHNIEAFDCGRSERVNNFIRSDHKKWLEYNYCRVFVLPDKADPATILGFYTLSAALLVRNEISNQHQKRAIGGIPVPLIRIGFMGRHKDAPRDTGAALVADAAARFHRNPDVAAWGLVLDAEGGEANISLIKRYEDIGFKKAKTLPGVMYGPLKSFLG